MQANPSLPEISRLSKLIIFDIDGTLTVPHTTQLLPGRREFFLALATEHKQGKTPSIALATNQGGVGFRHWLESTRPAWFAEKSEAEQAAQLAIYPTQIQAIARLNDVAESIGDISNIWPATYISFAWQFKSNGLWADIPPDAEKDIRWSHEWRKPNPGMLEQAIRNTSILPRQALMIGDHITDIRAGRLAGCATAWGKDFFREVGNE